MRIELNFGGLPFCPMPEFSWNLNDLLKKSEKVVSAFQKVKNQTHNINGGVGVLYPAVDLLETRIRQEEENINNLQTTQKKADEFIQLARSVDSQVASLVDQNKQEFYNDNPWSRPPDPPKEKSRCEQVFEWICGRYEEIKEGIHDIYEGLKGIVSGVGKIIDAHIHIIADVGNYIKDTAIKALDNINKWCVEHKDIVKIGIGAVALVAACIATGGVAVPLVIAGAGTLIGVGKGAVGYLNGTDKESGSIWEAMFHGGVDGFMSGSIAALTNAFIGSPIIGGAVSSGVSEVINSWLNDGKITLDEALNITINSVVGGIMGWIDAGTKLLEGKTILNKDNFKELWASGKDIFMKATGFSIVKELIDGTLGEIELWNVTNNIKTISDICTGLSKINFNFDFNFDVNIDFHVDFDFHFKIGVGAAY